MRIDFHGRLSTEPQIRAGFVGCGSHAFRNLYPALQFVPIDLVAVCDFDGDRARAFARQFGATASYTDHREMLEAEQLEAVFLCTGYDELGRPTYPDLARDALHAGCHVWMEKPPAASCAAIEAMQQAANEAQRQVMVGLKKMFFPANEKAHALMSQESFGSPHLLTQQYPQYVPRQDEFDAFRAGQSVPSVTGFLDHLCHPASLLIFLLGMPQSLVFQRSIGGGGLATFSFESGAVASIVLSQGAGIANGMEHTMIVSDRGQRITVENNLRVTLHRMPPLSYGNTPDYFEGDAGNASLTWEPEFSLGQLYNKGLFLLGYYNEIAEFASAIREERTLNKGHLIHARQVTRIFEAFFEGPGASIDLG